MDCRPARERHGLSLGAFSCVAAKPRSGKKCPRFGGSGGTGAPSRGSCRGGDKPPLQAKPCGEAAPTTADVSR